MLIPTGMETATECEIAPFRCARKNEKESPIERLRIESGRLPTLPQITVMSSEMAWLNPGAVNLSE